MSFHLVCYHLNQPAAHRWNSRWNLLEKVRRAFLKKNRWMGEGRLKFRLRTNGSSLGVDRFVEKKVRSRWFCWGKWFGRNTSEPFSGKNKRRQVRGWCTRRIHAKKEEREGWLKERQMGVRDGEKAFFFFVCRKHVWDFHLRSPFAIIRGEITVTVISCRIRKERKKNS